jgi:hypothetical protein
VCRRRQERTEFLGRRETKPRQSNFLDDDGNIPGHRAPRAPERHESSDGVRRTIISLAIYCIAKIDIGPESPILKANVMLATTSERAARSLGRYFAVEKCQNMRGLGWQETLSGRFCFSRKSVLTAALIEVPGATFESGLKTESRAVHHGYSRPS